MIDDEKLVHLPLKRKEQYPFQEERRLFYVAITRTRKNLFYLLSSRYFPIHFSKQ